MECTVNKISDMHPSVISYTLYINEPLIAFLKESIGNLFVEIVVSRTTLFFFLPWQQDVYCAVRILCSVFLICVWLLWIGMFKGYISYLYSKQMMWFLVLWIHNLCFTNFHKKWIFHMIYLLEFKVFSPKQHFRFHFTGSFGIQCSI